MTDLTVKVDFTIFTQVDPTIIAIGDKSRWGVAKNQPSNLLITPPGSKKAINHTFPKEKVHFLNATNLGLSCVKNDCSESEYEHLDDGIWEFCLQSAYQGLEKRRFFLKTDLIRIDLDKIYIKAGVDYNPNSDIVKDLFDAEFWLKCAHAHLRRGDKSKTNRDYNEARKIVDKYINCTNC